MFETDQECIDFLKGLEVQLTELLDLLVVAGRFPHQRLLGKIYVDDQALDEPEGGLWSWESAFEKMKR
jgi:hypothetical protein